MTVSTAPISLVRALKEPARRKINTIRRMFLSAAFFTNTSRFAQRGGNVGSKKRR